MSEAPYIERRGKSIHVGTRRDNGDSDGEPVVVEDIGGWILIEHGDSTVMLAPEALPHLIAALQEMEAGRGK